jgi:hypothetical protein
MWATCDKWGTCDEKIDAGALVLLGEAGLGELQLKLAQDIDGGEDSLGLLAEAGGHFEEDAVDFALFVFEQADKLVVLLDGFQRLDKDGLAAGTGAVDDALDAALLLDLDRDDEAVAADSDQFVLQGIAFREAAKITAQRVLDGAALLLDLAADGGEGGRGVVIESSVGRELVGEIVEERGEILERGAELLDGGPGFFHGLRRMGGGFAPFGGAVDEEDDVAEFGGLQNGSADAGTEHELAGIG